MLIMASNPTTCLSSVAAEIRHHVDQPLFAAARVGVFAQQGDHVLLNLDGDRRFVPASLVKLATTVAVWRQLGQNFRLVTRVWGDRLPDASGTVGHVWVEGVGDPQLTTAHLQNLARQLRQRGIRRIQRSSVGTNLRGSGIAPTWEVGDLGEYYGAIAHGLTVNGNSILWNLRPGPLGEPARWTWEQPAEGWQIHNYSRTVPRGEPDTLDVRRPWGQEQVYVTGSLPVDRATILGGVAVPDPQQTFQRAWRSALRQEFGVAPTTGAIAPKPGGVILAEHPAPSLAVLIATTNQDSDNLHAELLLRLLGQQSLPQAPDHGVAGLAVVTEFWQSQGITPQQMHLADGSGLSRHNLITPRTLVTILRSVAQDGTFRRTLAIAGQSGTLKSRTFTIPGTLQGKTGTATGISSLAGFLIPADSTSEITFAIVINHSSAPPAQNRALIAAIVNQLGRLQAPRCGNPK